MNTSKPLSRRALIKTMRLGLLGSFLPWLGACTSEGPFKLAAHPWQGYELMFLARNLGWLDSAKAVLVESKTPGESMELLRGSEVHGAALTLEEVLLLQRDGIALTIPALFNVSSGADKIVAHSRFKTFSSLKGRRIGVETGSMGEMFLLQILEMHDLDINDFHIAHVPIDRHLEIWQLDQIDALVTFGSAANFIVNTGAHVLEDSSALPHQVIDVVCVRSEIAALYEEQIKYLLEKQFKALSHFHDFPFDAMARMSRRLATPPEQVEDLFRDVILLDLHENHRLLTGSPAPIEKTTDHLHQIVSEFKGDLQAPLAPLDFTADFLPSEDVL